MRIATIWQSYGPYHLARVNALDRVVRDAHDGALNGRAADAVNQNAAWSALLAPLLAGHDMGLISEAGLPAIADPGPKSRCRGRGGRPSRFGATDLAAGCKQPEKNPAHRSKLGFTPRGRNDYVRWLCLVCFSARRSRSAPSPWLPVPPPHKSKSKSSSDRPPAFRSR